MIFSSLVISWLIINTTDTRRKVKTNTEMILLLLITYICSTKRFEREEVENGLK